MIPDESPCGVLMDLKNIHTFFNPGDEFLSDDDDVVGSIPPESHSVKVDAYPLAFLRVAGNLQATGIPHCFYPILTEVNRSVRKDPNRFSPESDDDSFVMDVDLDLTSACAQVVRPIAAQFYNLIAHRIATRAGKLDAQQGTVTAALSGKFAQTPKDRATAYRKQAYCAQALPSDRFHRRIHRSQCPTSCRAEYVYSVDVRSLRSQSGKCVTPPSPFPHLSSPCLTHNSSPGLYSTTLSSLSLDPGNALRSAT